MSAAAKAEAKAKLDKLKIEIGTPRRDLDYTVQPMGRGSFGGNMLIASTWRHREEMKRIGRGNADRRWDVLPQQPALAYDIAQNRLIVTAAMLQAPVLDMTRGRRRRSTARSARWSATSSSHAVDDKGRMVDAAGNVRDWWTPAEAARGMRSASAWPRSTTASTYPALKGVKVNGALTRDENMADLAGVELAWDACATRNPPATTAAKQAFFQGWAQLWAQQLQPRKPPHALAASDVHAPGQWRANGPLMNQPAFGEAFACKAGTPMQPKDAISRSAIWPLMLRSCQRE